MKRIDLSLKSVKKFELSEKTTSLLTAVLAGVNKDSMHQMSESEIQHAEAEVYEQLLLKSQKKIN